MNQIFENYQIVREIGSGHFGTVFLAVGSVPGRGFTGRKERVVAIKKLNDATPESVDLLLREFSLLDQVKHRCIVRVFEYISEHNAVVMEYIHGVNLRKVLDDLQRHNQAMFTDAAVEIGCEIADALYQAFTTPGDNGEPLQLVHRDLKPANIMLTQNGEIKILDFGLARVDNAEFTMDNGEIRGTPIYMAPEQARGQSIDHRTDLFSLGLILYELLMKEPAYKIPLTSSDPVRAVLSDIAYGRTSFEPNKLIRELPQLGPVLVKVLQSNPKHRYSNGQELLVDMRRQLSKEHGQSIREFAQYYFDTIHPMTPVPSLQEMRSTVVPPPPSETKSRISASDRLKQLRASHAAAPPDLEMMLKSDSVVSSGPSPTAQPPPVEPVKHQNNPISAGVHMSNERKRPPIGGGASRSNNAPTPRPTRGPTPMPGARSPDETGMLKMAPLGQSFSDDTEDEGSETRFFTSAPPPSQGPPSSGGAAQQPERPAGSVPGYGGSGQNYVPPQGNLGTPQQNLYQSAPNHNPPQNPQMAIGLGDAAGGGYGGGNAGTPFNSANVNSNYVDNDEATGRTGSMRVYLLVSVLFVMVSITIVIALWFLFNNPDSDQQIVEDGYNKQAGYAPIEPSEEVYEEPEPEPVVQPAATPSNRNTQSVRRGGGSTNRGGSNSSQSSAPSAPASGTLTVRINSSLPVGELEVTCGGTRIGRTRVTGSVGSFTNIPNGNCELFFKPTVAKYQGQLSGRSLTCTIAAGGATVSCN